MLVIADFGFLFGWHERVHICLLLQVEVFEVRLPIGYVWFKRWRDLLCLDLLDINVGKPWMREYLFYTTLSTQPSLLVFIKKFVNDVYEVVRVFQTIFLLIRENNFGPLDFGEQQVLVLIKERCHAYPHFVNQNSECPPVDRKIVTRLQNHLRSKILRCSTICPGHAARVEHFCQTKVDNFEIAIHVNEDVLQLEVPMNNALAMEISQCQGNLHCVKFNLFFLKSSTCLKKSVELSTPDEGHYEE